MKRALDAGSYPITIHVASSALESDESESSAAYNAGELAATLIVRQLSLIHIYIKTLSGNGQGNSENSLSYGLSVKYNSTQTTTPYNPSWEGQDSTYSYKSISEIRNSSSENRNDSPDANVTLQEDTRYMVRYTTVSYTYLDVYKRQ